MEDKVISILFLMGSVCLFIGSWINVIRNFR